jgi:proton-dependent oligopeptide transporter, POT family
MGVYFAMTGFGNKLAGLLGESASQFGELYVFSGIAIFCVLFGLIVMVFRKKLEKLTHGAEDDEHEIFEQENYELADPDINKP